VSSFCIANVCTYIVFEQNDFNYKQQALQYSCLRFLLKLRTTIGSTLHTLYSVDDCVKGRNLSKQALKDSCVRFLLILRAAFPMADSVFGRRLRQE